MQTTQSQQTAQALYGRCVATMYAFYQAGEDASQQTAADLEVNSNMARAAVAYAMGQQPQAVAALEALLAQLTPHGQSVHGATVLRYLCVYWAYAYNCDGDLCDLPVVPANVEPLLRLLAGYAHLDSGYVA